MTLDTPISELTRVGKTTAGRLKQLGLETVRDLIFYFPFRYEDYSLQKKISDLLPDEAVTVRGKVQLIANRHSWRKRKTLTEALISDDTGSLKVVWFNQPYLSKTIKVGDELFLSGKVSDSRVEMISPDYEKVKADTLHTARLVPIYHLTEGLTQKQVRFLANQAMLARHELEEFLPREILNKYKFRSLSEALGAIHFPKNNNAAEAARRRLQFDELFLIQLAIQTARQSLMTNKSPAMPFVEKQTKDFVDGLPFKLTGAQKKCSWEIIRDIEKEKPMNRLLEGDVGSGKTVVVALAILNVALNGYKTVMMAPTEILAEQHYHTLRRLFAKQNFRIALFTAGKRMINDEQSTKKGMLEVLATGGFDVVVGTQAVIQENVKIRELGLVVVDEQHRFGVNQRKALLQNEQKQLTPHFLSMTATPIPRSLVLAMYGDLDLSVIDELPAGRKAIITKVVYEQQRLATYEFIRRQVVSGRQVFVICPLIDPSDNMGFKSVKQEYEKLDKEVFSELKIGLMHGRLKSIEKQKVMASFATNEIKILVSTSVVEVGIDVPNATIMMVEGADRFGLAQLHQFRGRVGRGAHQSYCFLFSESAMPNSQKRLKYMETCRDGFNLAEKDLEMRGPGEVYGVRQSGLPDLKIASLSDAQMIKVAQAEAKDIIAKNKMSPELRAAVERLEVSMHFE
ncbi:MAG: ATP-dependent DNA helicase RecG [Parcubacteria group bacterium]